VRAARVIGLRPGLDNLGIHLHVLHLLNLFDGSDYRAICCELCCPAGLLLLWQPGVVGRKRFSARLRRSGDQEWRDDDCACGPT